MPVRPLSFVVMRTELINKFQQVSPENAKAPGADLEECFKGLPLRVAISGRLE